MSQLSPIYQACLQGQSIRVAELIDKGADVNSTDPKGFSCLHAAVNAGSLDTTQVLVKKGHANVNVKDKGSAKGRSVKKKKSRTFCSSSAHSRDLHLISHIYHHL
jgi:ankyrin repeat protein